MLKAKRHGKSRKTLTVFIINDRYDFVLLSLSSQDLPSASGGPKGPGSILPGPRQLGLSEQPPLLA